ncbi:8838_t:CDS:2 [Funneliformis caledonium]|uniref:8838_t:CDS:1 n=1 Tax=Funneliformis caledonium TaxID=1117310 RepID=A0A9N9D441_9GLOM|nr:8838_t:CDS:2 [Funneliformis caledonium]
MSIVLKKHNIWYKLKNCHVISLNQLPGFEFSHFCKAIKQKSGLSEPDSLTLQIKREVNTEYISLNNTYFRDNCGKSFKRLVSYFGIKPTNPIKVTLSDMFFPFMTTLNDERIQELEKKIAEMELAKDQADLEKRKEEGSVGRMLEHVPEFKYASIAFNHEFNDKSEFLNHFQQYIDKCHYKSKDIYMPYLTVIQSSGYGKSRLIKERFWEWQLNDNGKSIWSPAIAAVNMYESQRELELIRDNADYLKENFRNARGLFSVILDTTSRLSNFAPSPRDDPTVKSINDSRKIFMPFINITTFNTLTDSSGTYYNRLFSNGRPCWKALKDAYCKGINSEENDIYAWDKVINLVKAKIQGDISPLVHFASNLIGSHLGTCFAISQDRMKVLVCYPSEPLITEAVYELLNNDILDCIAQTLGQGIVEPGKHGEIVGELILILTY